MSRQDLSSMWPIGQSLTIHQYLCWACAQLASGITRAKICTSKFFFIKCLPVLSFLLKKCSFIAEFKTKLNNIFRYFLFLWIFKPFKCSWTIFLLQNQNPHKKCTQSNWLHWKPCFKMLTNNDLFIWVSWKIKKVRFFLKENLL